MPVDLNCSKDKDCTNHGPSFWSRRMLTSIQTQARVGGARVYPGGEKEIGWGEVELTDAGSRSVLAPLAGKPVLHWHGDTFDVPRDAERAGRGRECLLGHASTSRVACVSLRAGRPA